MHYGYTGNTGKRGKSEAMWTLVPWHSWAHGEGGFFDFDDFVNPPVMSTTATTGKYQCFADTGCTIAGIDGQWGQLRFSLDGTAADATAIQWGGGAGSSIQFSTSSKYAIGWECRLKKSTVANDLVGFFAGLADENQAADNTLVDTTLALEDSANFIGFHCVSDGDLGAVVNFVWRASGQTAVTCLASAKTLSADTYTKLGFLYLPGGHVRPSQRIRIFVDGVQQSTFGTDTQVAAATFPSAINFSPILYFKQGEGSTACSATVDWLAVGHGDMSV